MRIAHPVRTKVGVTMKTKLRDASTKRRLMSLVTDMAAAEVYVGRLNIQVRSLAGEYGVATVEPEDALIG